MNRFINILTGKTERQRTPTAFKQTLITSASGTTITLWTPATGKVFRLLQFQMQLPLGTTMASAGILDQELYDGASLMNMGFSDYLPNTTPTNAIGDNHTALRLPENGYRSQTAGNTLKVVLSSALATGKIRYVFNGTEEWLAASE